MRLRKKLMNLTVNVNGQGRARPSPRSEDCSADRAGSSDDVQATRSEYDGEESPHFDTELFLPGQRGVALPPEGAEEEDYVIERATSIMDAKNEPDEPGVVKDWRSSVKKPPRNSSGRHSQAEFNGIATSISLTPNGMKALEVAEGQKHDLAIDDAAGFEKVEFENDRFEEFQNSELKHEAKSKDSIQEKRSKDTKRKKPVQLLELKMTEDTDLVFADDIFTADGTFQAEGFAISNAGIVQAPGIKRINSQGELVDGIPPSTRKNVLITSFADIEYKDVIGAGSSGKVKLAQHTLTDTRVAVKIVNVYDSELRKQLLKELQTLTTYVSRFLVRFYGAFYTTGEVHVLLEFMDGGSLEEAIKIGGSVPEVVARQIAKHCLHGLNFLHKWNVLHRDLKSGNILLSRRQNRSKLSDFGLSKKVSNDNAGADTFVGTKMYMSPERLRGNQYTSAGDIWGLGLSICESLLGRFPWKRLNAYFELIHNTENASSIERELEAAKVSGDARDFVLQCMKVEPTQRPTAEELLKHPFVSGQMEPERFARWLGKLRERKKKMAAAAAERESAP